MTRICKISINMEMSQEYYLYSYLKQTKMSFFFFHKIGEQEGEAGPVWVVGTSGRDEDVGRGCRRMDIIQILCTHVCKWKIEGCWDYSRNVGRGIMENDGRGEFKYDILDIL
jgi:hypothetical protein